MQEVITGVVFQKTKMVFENRTMRMLAVFRWTNRVEQNKIKLFEMALPEENHPVYRTRIK